MKLAWCTDIHLNFLEKEQRDAFYQEVIKMQSDAVLITGDIAEGPSVVPLMKEMSEQIHLPIYFIVGNHDYYHAAVDEVRHNLTALINENDKLFWLPASGIQPLNNETVLLGQDGWADGRLGDYVNSRVSLIDSRLITDLFQAKILGKFHLLDKMQELADKDARALQVNLEEAYTLNPKKIIVLTHVPPFKEACMHEGKISDDDWLPYFSSKIMGDILTQAAKEKPSIDYLILCGHTHSDAYYKPLDNLTVKVGAAEYGEPRVWEVIDA
jgi:predicted MPP superfamily phosphohydrolase